MQPAENPRIGLAFFAFYLFFYAAFVLVSAFAPAFLEREIAGVTLAIHAGLVLILGAIGLAVLYCWICRTTPSGKQDPRA